MPEKTEPILTFYYNSKDLVYEDISTTSSTTKIRIGSLQGQTYKDYERNTKSGRITYQNLASIIDNLYIYTGNAVLSFLDNSKDLIIFASNGSDDTYSDTKKFKQNETVFNKIIEGKGQYASLEGTVVINTFENGDRICYVYSTN